MRISSMQRWRVQGRWEGGGRGFWLEGPGVGVEGMGGSCVWNCAEA